MAFPPREPPSDHYLRARGLLTPKVLTKRATEARAARKPAARCVEVYFIKAVTLGHIKIGKSDNARSRFTKLRLMSPDTLMMLGVVRCHEAGALEKALHRQFSDHRVHGEWFRPAPEILRYIAENASTPDPETHWRVIRRKAA